MTAVIKYLIKIILVDWFAYKSAQTTVNLNYYGEMNLIDILT